MKTLHTAISEADWIRLNDLLKQALEVEVLEREAWMAALPPRYGVCSASWWQTQIPTPPTPSPPTSA